MNLTLKPPKPELKDLLSKFIRTSCSAAGADGIGCPLGRDDALDLPTLLVASDASESNQRENILHPKRSLSDRALLEDIKVSEIAWLEHATNTEQTF